MYFELHCPSCQTHFSLPEDSPVATVLDEFADQGPWALLGDGTTLEDTVCCALQTREADHCPQCGASVTANEENLSQFARELLGQW